MLGCVSAAVASVGSVRTGEHPLCSPSIRALRHVEGYRVWAEAMKTPRDPQATVRGCQPEAGHHRHRGPS